MRKNRSAVVVSSDGQYLYIDSRYIDAEISNIGGFDKSSKQTLLFEHQKTFYFLSLVSTFMFMVISHCNVFIFKIVNNQLFINK